MLSFIFKKLSNNCLEKIVGKDRVRGCEIQELEDAETLRIGDATDAKIRFPHGRENIEAYSLFEGIALSRGYTGGKAIPLPSDEGGSRRAVRDRSRSTIPLGVRGGS